MEIRFIQLIIGERKEAGPRNISNKTAGLGKILNEIAELKNINTRTGLKNNSEKRKV
jgi:hypothetical protein